jgi:hypothetical protein
VDVLSS